MPRESLPVADFRPDLVRWRQLVSPAWLAALVAGAQPEAAPAAGWRLFEVACGGEAAFAQAHIPGASYLDSCQFEQKPLWNKVADDALLALLLASGVRHDTSVILYGRNMLAAARVAHLMLYAGVRDVRLLDGGFALWQAGGYRCVAGEGAPVQPVMDFGGVFPAHPEYLICTAQARALLAAPDGALASIRTEAEFLGKESGYSYISAKGDIPGARWGRAGEDGDVNSMSAYQYAGWPHASGGRDLRAVGRNRHRAHGTHGVLLRHRLARVAGILLCLADGLAPYQRLRRWLVRVERRRSQSGAVSQLTYLTWLAMK